MRSVDVSAAASAPTVVASAKIVDDSKAAAYCSLQVVVDDYAKFELHLPVSAWTQRLLFGGGPGAQTASSVNLEQFATVSWQDLGRRGHEDDFAANYQYRINAAYRGMHLQVLAAKALIAKYYGQGPRFSYYNACSEPGREGMMEVQRFPEDFDGVGAGCPPLNFTLNNGLFQAWSVLSNTGPDGKFIITADKLPILHKAVLDQCDAADGVKDGIVSEPLSCHVNLAPVECKPGVDPSTCLTTTQVNAAAEIYRGPHDGQGGKLAPIGVLPGSELAWTATMVESGGRWGGPMETRAQTTTAIRSQFSDPALPASWELGDVKFDRETFDATTKLHYLYDAIDPDLTAFAKAGHKLILWQGMGDTNVLPAHAVLYYTALQQQMGAKAVDGFVRFYALPGVYHCGGGDGPVINDFLGPLMLWVERGVAPEAIIASHRPQAPGGMGPGPANGPPPTVDLTRPVYPYPYVAKYTGKGNIRDAANYVKGPARPAPASLFEWFGSGYYTAGFNKWCTATDMGLNCRKSR